PAHRQRALEQLEREDLAGFPIRDLLLEPATGFEIASTRGARPFSHGADDLRFRDAGVVAIERLERGEHRPDFLRRGIDADPVLEHGHDDTSFGLFFFRSPAIRARMSASSPARSRRSRRTNFRSAAVFGSYLALQPMISSMIGRRSMPLGVSR